MHLLRPDALAQRARSLLRSLRPKPRAQSIYVAYVVCVMACLYVVPYGAVGADYLRFLDSDVAARGAAAFPVAVAAVILGLLSVSVHDGSWRGSVRAEAAEIDWVISGPLSWPRLMMSRVVSTALTLSVCGAGAAAVSGAVSTVLRHERITVPGIVQAAIAGAFVGLICCACNVMSQVFLRPDSARVVATSLRVGAAVAATVALIAALRHQGLELPAALWWSGPWGWMAIVTGDVFPSAAADTIALLLCVALGLTTAAVAALGVIRIQAAALRSRAGRYDGVLAALMSADTRLAGQLTELGQRRRPRRRHPPARGPLSACLWHVVTGWVRQPGPPAAGLVWVAAGVLLPTVWLDDPPPAAAVGVLLVYRGVSLLLENVRLQTDDVHRSAHLPQALASTMLSVCRIGASVAVGGAVIVIAISGHLGYAPSMGSVLVAATIPAAAVAVSVTACRGQLPLELLIGAETPFGNSGPAQVALWFAQVPVALVVFSAVVSSIVPSATGSALTGDNAIATLSATAASMAFLWVMVAWLRGRVAALLQS